MNKNLELLVDKHKNDIYKLCLKLTSNQDDANDLFQDTWLKVLNNSYDKDKNYNNYLYTICLNTYRDSYNKRKRWLNIIFDYFSNEEKIITINNSKSKYTVEDEVIKNESNQMISSALLKLDDKYKIPIILFYLKDNRIKDISEILDVPEGIIKSRLSTGKKKLREMIGGNNYG